MTMPNTTQSPSQAGLVFQDALSRRLGWAILASLAGNLLLWRGVAAMARRPVHFDPKPVEITRVILQPNGKRIEKVIKKEQIAKKIVQVRKEIHKEVPKEIPKPLPVVHRERPHIVTPAPHRAPPQTAHHETPPPLKPQPLPQPETAHNRVLTAPDNKTAPTPTDHIVQAGGNADIGKPIIQQGTGNARTSPDVVVKKDAPKPPEPIRQPDPPKPAKSDLPSGNDKKDVPAPDSPKPELPKPELPKPDPPKKRGPTREAEPADQTKPDIPDELKHGDFKSFVRVAVDIDTDGSFTVTLRTSSGNQDVDNRVLDALKKWKWKPALRNGEAYKSTQRFKFEFEVQ